MLYLCKMITCRCKKCKISKHYKNFIVLINNKEDLVKICKKCRTPRKNLTERQKKDNVNRYKRQRYKKDILFKYKIRVRNIISLSINQRKGYTKKSKTTDILGCSFEFFKEYIESQFKENMTWDNIHLDHIIPLNEAKNEKEVLDLCHYTNFQPLFAIDNIKKGCKVL